ncbi:L-seryl-tRNA(Sec) selenium transferase [Oryzobacter telluris]|uniref:L-seryl-tRNA(Sec) selenium transferase n=1 Tax=Oryzobacter telluris TaxID=3149179 RepID=UPI00370DD828
MPQEPQSADPRRSVPRTDVVLADPLVAAAVARLGAGVVRPVVSEVLDLVRSGALSPGGAVAAVVAGLPPRATSLRRVLNATGVVLHTNLGRAPLSQAAVEAMVAAAGTVDIELDLASGRRGLRAPGVVEALLAEVPAAEAALVVNNGAAALVLATTALASGGEVLVSRGEMVEIGDGFRLHELVESAGVRVREVGTTNRTHLRDYASAVSPATGAVLKVHPSNFTVDGFTREVPVRELAGLGVPVVHDLGSGLLRPHPLLPDEPDATSSLRDGAAVVTFSGDKLLGGPQAGIVLGRRDVVERMRRHPLARALRPGKTTLAALEATLRGPLPPAPAAVASSAAGLRGRCERMVAALASGGVVAEVVASEGRVGGGSAPGVVLAGWAVSLPSSVADALRAGDPAVLARVHEGRALLDLRALAGEDDDVVVSAVLAAVVGSRGR